MSLRSNGYAWGGLPPPLYRRLAGERYRWLASRKYDAAVERLEISRRY
jgi:hypothetical protein